MNACKNIFSKAICLITAFFIGLAAFCILLYFYRDLSRKGLALRENLLLVAAAVLCAGTLCLFFIFLCRFIDHTADKSVSRLTFILFLIYLAGIAIVLINFNVYPMTDSFCVQDQALAIALGNTDQIDTTPQTYFGNYANNNFLVLVFVWFYKILSRFGITNFNFPSILLNALMLVLGEILCYLGVKKLFNPRFACKYLALSVANPILYLTVPWVYSLSFCMPLMGGVLYLGACVYRQKNKYKLIAQSGGFGILAVLGYFIRPVVLILCIGYAVCLLLWLTKDKKKLLKSALCVASCLVFTAATYLSVSASIYKICPDTSSTYPVTHWIMMGLHGDGTLNLDDNGYTKQFDTKEEKVQANLAEIKRTLKAYTPASFMRHLLIKFTRTWGDGDSDFASRLQQDQHYTFLYRYTAGSQNIAFLTYCTAYRLAIYLLASFALVHLFFKRKWKNTMFLPAITLFGGILFYLIWEAKQSYCIPFLFLVILLGASGGSTIGQKKWNFPKIYHIAMPVCICLTVLLSVFHYPTFALQKNTLTDISVKCNNETGTKSVKDIAKEERTMEQTFFTAKAFDTIEFYCKALDGDAPYTFTILDDQHQSLVKQQITKQQIKGKVLKIKFPQIEPDGRRRYTLRITADGDAKTDSVSFETYRYQRLTGYDGELSIDNTNVRGDIRMNVYHVYNGVQIRSVLYILAAIFWIALQVLVWFLSRKKKTPVRQM